MRMKFTHLKMAYWRERMKNSLKIAFRNTLRNKRRTTMSVLAIAIGGLASLLIGAFVSSIFYGMQTNIVRNSGHLHIHKEGFFKYGSAKTGTYDMANYKEIINGIKESPIISKIEVITPILMINGIVGNPVKNSSQTFLGVGMEAKEQLLMQTWDGFGLGLEREEIPLESLLADKGIIGNGLAVNLDLCEALNIKGCLISKADESSPVDQDISSFYQPTTVQNIASVDMMVSSANGAPNIASIEIDTVWRRGIKNLDDRFVGLPLAVAQNLLYGGGEKKVNAIVIQLERSEKLEETKQQLEVLFKTKGWALEIVTLEEFNAQFSKVLNMFGVVFGFVSVIIAIIVLFTVSNTMTMSVMERYREIGTLRAIGLKRRDIRKYFVLEGAMIGLMGATLGVFLAYVVTTVINHSDMTWSPPSNSSDTRLILHLLENPLLIIVIWLVLVVISMFSAFFPANKAANMPIVDALRHH